MKTIFFLLISVFIAYGQNNESNKNKIIVEIYGDLTQNGKEEKIVVSELDQFTEKGKIRMLEIFAKENDKWVVIASSKTAIMQSENGGMKADPFCKECISINNNLLMIKHFGSSSWKWNNLHKYRFQNNTFELIGYETDYGKPCYYHSKLSYNLITGKALYSKKYDFCEDKATGYLDEDEMGVDLEETFVHKMDTLPNIENINQRSYEIITPKYHAEFIF